VELEKGINDEETPAKRMVGKSKGFVRQDDRMATIDLDQKIKQAIASWPNGNYGGASLVTKRLLEL